VTKGAKEKGKRCQRRREEKKRSTRFECRTFSLERVLEKWTKKERPQTGKRFEVTSKRQASTNSRYG